MNVRRSFRAARWSAYAALVLATSWAAGLRADRQLRAELLQQARLVAVSICPDRAAALTGTPDDLGSAPYLHFKERLADVQRTVPECRFAYLMARRTDGAVVFLVDNEPDDSPDCSPPGQVYTNLTHELLSVLAGGPPVVEGPHADPWGTWVSALAAVATPDEGRPVLVGLDVDARRWKWIVAAQAAIPAGIASAALLLALLAAELSASRRRLRFRQTELETSERRLLELAAQSRTVAWEVDAQGLYTYASPVAETVYGYRPEELVGKMHFYDLHPEEGREEFRQTALAAFARREPFIDFENAVVAKDGRNVWVSTSGLPVPAADGTLRGYRGSDVDVTARKRAEEALRENDLKLRTLFASMDEIVALHELVCDAAGTPRDYRLTDVNEAFCRLTGRTREESIGKLASETYRAMPPPFLADNPWQGRMVNRRKDGTTFTEDAVISPVFDAQGRIVNYVGVKRDVSEQLRQAAQLQQAQKMDSIGRLAGGVAHDFNNMLTVILGHAEMKLADPGLDPSVRASLEEIRHAATDSAALTRQLLAFARKQTIAPRLLDLNETVGQSIQMLRRLIGENIELTWRPAPDALPVQADPAQLDQILVNLCVNARDAIDGTGRIDIETGNATLDAAFCANHPGAVPGDYARLTVRDTGCGMDADTLAHAFEPFYTTKPAGAGTGLGLSTVYGIVKQNDGYVALSSAPGQGAAIDVYLPRRAAAQTSGAAAPVPLPAATGAQTVLLVEDEPAILAVTAQMLSSLGYVVRAAHTPAEAIRVAKEHSGPIHLLLTDVVMPGLNGRDLARTLADLRPGLRALFMSGYNADVIARNGILDPRLAFVRKPFTRDELAAKVREVLGA